MKSLRLGHIVPRQGKKNLMLSSFWEAMDSDARNGKGVGFAFAAYGHVSEVVVCSKSRLHKWKRCGGPNIMPFTCATGPRHLPVGSALSHSTFPWWSIPTTSLHSFQWNLFVGLLCLSTTTQRSTQSTMDPWEVDVHTRFL